MNDSPPLLGKTLDVSGNKNDGTLVGDTHVVAGKFGSALEFDGTDDSVNCGNSNVLDLTSSLTLLIWLKIEDNTSRVDLLTKREWLEINDNAGYTLFYRGDLVPKKFTFIMYNDFQSLAVYNIDVTNQYYQVTCVYDGISGLIYLNGMPGNIVASSGIKSTLNPFHISLASKSLDGIIDYVMVYNRALSPVEVRQSFISPFCMFERKPIALWSAATSAQIVTVLDYERSTRGLNRGVMRGVV